MPRFPLREAARLECALANVDLVEDQSQRIEVALNGDRLAVELLRRHVGWRARHFALRRLSGADREAEVRNSDATPPIQHDVRRFEIAMEYALVVCGGEPGAQLTGDLVGLPLRQAADAAKERCEILTVDVLHRDEVMAVDFTDVVDTADVRMRYLPGVAHFGVKALEKACVPREARRQELERDGLSELEILSAIHLAHSAAAEEADDAIAIGQQPAGREGRSA